MKKAFASILSAALVVGAFGSASVFAADSTGESAAEMSAAAVDTVIGGIDSDIAAVYCDIALALPCCAGCVIEFDSLDALCRNVGLV